MEVLVVAFPTAAEEEAPVEDGVAGELAFVAEGGELFFVAGDFEHFL